MKMCIDKGFTRCTPDDFALSARQFEVLVHAASGFSRKGIASNLGIAESTVSEHLKQIYKKLNVHNRSAAVSVAFNCGLIHPVAPTSGAGVGPMQARPPEHMRWRDVNDLAIAAIPLIESAKSNQA